MKANFALSLSHDGIVLLQHSAAGWTRVGEADPSSETLSDDLEALRRAAMALAPSGVRCKLVIPDDQIRYLSIPTPGLDLHDREAAARVALEGATPYEVDELAFDVCTDGDQTHIAAVALETLEEAESFATAHGWQPVGFAAQPGPDHSYSSEPDFGPCACTAEEPQPDPSSALEISSSVSKPTLAEASGQDETADPEPSFVSRRRVPTFRTQSPPPEMFTGATAGSVPGFGEPDHGFEPAAAATRKQTPTVVPAPAPVVRRTENDAERFTIYGTRGSDGVSGRMGLAAVGILATVALVAGGAAFVSSATNGSGPNFWDRLVTAEPEVQFNAPTQPQTAVTVVEDPAQAPDVELTALEPQLSDEDVAVLDAQRAPATEEPVAPTEDDLRADYAVTGIWPVAPDVPSPPALVDLEDLYVTSIDPINPNFDAVALPSLKSQEHDHNFLTPASPAPAGTKFVLDDRGMVVPTPDGSLNPDGVMVFAGPPPARQPSNMVKAEDPGVDLKERMRLAGFRPKSRPADLIETSERAAFSGLTRSELSEIRPRLRPQSAQENALASASLVQIDEGNSRSLLEDPNEEGTNFDSATARAIVASLRPDARPKDFDKTVAKALERRPAPQPTTAAARVAPRAVTPKIPSSASATREATVKNAINLRKVNLIGVYGTPSSRRALVRLSSGRYMKVQVGDRIDGGRVSAIGDSELRYQKSGRAIVLKMPRG